MSFTHIWMRGTGEEEQSKPRDKDAYFRIVGDIHEEWKMYLEMVHHAEYTLQVGDLSVCNYDRFVVEKVDPERHKFIGGNHDNYDIVKECPHYLEDFGVWDIPDIGKIFYVRGAWSIDHKARDIGVNMWEEEEISYEQGLKALKLYEEVKPDIVVSHECPLNVVRHVTDPAFCENHGYTQPVIKTRTNQLLQAMTEIHRPKIHLFGHYHEPVDWYIDGVSGDLRSVRRRPEHDDLFTRYICVGLWRFIDLPRNFLETM